MQRDNPIAIETLLAKTMLEEVLHNPQIRQVLKDISNHLITHVIRPLEAELAKVENFSELLPTTQELIINLAAEHTGERFQRGAVLPALPSKESIISSIVAIRTLLKMQEESLDVDSLFDVEDVVTVMKIHTELGFTYYEAPADWHSDQFGLINQTISATKEELDMRLFRAELGQPAMLALTEGIGAELGKDLGLESDKIGWRAGKSVFGRVSMEERLKFWMEKYDSTNEDKYAKRLAEYQIPLIPSERQPLADYAAKWKTFFEKLMLNPKTGASFPLVASVSRATTRLLVCLQDIGAFNRPDDSFNFDAAQIYANCMMGFIVHIGHHSIYEVAEVYNRLIDFVAIEHLEKHGQPIVQVAENEKVEEKIPYCRIGNYYSFFYPSYAEDIKQKVETQNTLLPPAPSSA